MASIESASTRLHIALHVLTVHAHGSYRAASTVRTRRSLARMLLQACACGVALAGWLACTFAHAACSPDADWPVRPVRIIVPGGAGGVIDIRARWLAERLGPALCQPVIVENKPGAGGNIGTAFAAHSAPDGYTLVIVHQGTMTINPHLYPRAGYDPLTDLMPITRVGVGPLVLAVNSAVPVRSVRELVTLAKAQPGRLAFGSPGIGTPPHMAGELFKHMAGIDIIHVPYRGGGQAASDLVAGHIDMSIEGTNVQLPSVRSGRVRALAVTGAKRNPALPDVPTMSEAGIAGYRFEGWVGIAAPAGTPAPIVDRLYREIHALLATREAHDWFAEYGLEPGGDAPAVFSASVREEHAMWGAFIRDTGLHVE
jgi:tripartite-type tricarboxylate transporter receptor subunit TctC